jgi:hypothetical protein
LVPVVFRHFIDVNPNELYTTDEVGDVFVLSLDDGSS